MRALRARCVVVGAVMVAAAALAFAVKPTYRIADHGPKIDLESMIPERFGEWQIDRSIMPVTVSPDVQAKLDKIYYQTLSRTYVNARGQRVMLAIAYGGNQDDEIQVHRPEICYTAQGFQVVKDRVEGLPTQYGEIPIKRLLAVLGDRSEPITYWVTIGDRVTRYGISHKLERLRYGLTGRVPDGMLVRVSTIDRDEERAYAIQDQFVNTVLAVLPPHHRVRLAGQASYQ